MLWAEKTSYQLEKLTEKCKIAILPIGSIEQHGAHLPTGTDHIIVWKVAKKVAERIQVLLLPLMPYGYSEEHLFKPGTITISSETLQRFIREVAVSLSKNEVRHIVVVSGHAGQLFQLDAVCFELNVEGILGDAVVYNLSPYNVVDIERLGEILEEEIFIHAEELETSIMLFCHPELVDMKRAVKEVPPFLPTGINSKSYSNAVRILVTRKILERSSRSGICGDATLATKEKGEKLISLLVDNLVEVINRLIIEW